MVHDSWFRDADGHAASMLRRLLLITILAVASTGAERRYIQPCRSQHEVKEINRGKFMPST
ncbi:hypothetical protein I7I50_08027 [Histoplasma capsulatum G186AR]|uniref:Uncharacterized protein n=1 Tax=Ajellomyces capsulatus TaxID=5037 RepID=A0A8H7YKK3_AJECA|nr:hypothetical protein I7I52_08543 [Histoplasma capsulatum]QSS68572.1 hypothetical protein I7I50_08027 [Histoplasma capsulatum G186AR]